MVELPTLRAIVVHHLQSRRSLACVFRCIVSLTRAVNCAHNESRLYTSQDLHMIILLIGDPFSLFK